CLTGKPPFQAATTLGTLDLLRSQEPVRPGQLNPKVPRDLEMICLTCLQKEPYKRYATAGELAEEMRRFLDGEPILAPPGGGAERLWKFIRRKPMTAAFVTTLGLLILTLVVLLYRFLVPQ